VCPPPVPKAGAFGAGGGSVADPGCLTRILDPEFYPSRIPDPKTAMKDRSEKKLVVIPFFWSHKFHKIELFYF
jgi:hypothetical protein